MKITKSVQLRFSDKEWDMVNEFMSKHPYIAFSRLVVSAIVEFMESRNGEVIEKEDSDIF